MGLKAEIKKLNQIIEMKDKQIDVMFAALKQIIIEKGETDNGSWLMRIPEFVPDGINERYHVDTEPQDGGYLIMRVTEKKEEE